MGKFEQILLLVKSFLIKLCGTQFLSHLLEHLRTLMCFNHPITKTHHHFNQEVCEYLMKKNLSNNYFINIMIIQSSILRMILGS